MSPVRRMSQPSRAFSCSYFPPETTTSLSLAANHLVEVGHHQQELPLRGGDTSEPVLIGTTWREKAMEGGLGALAQEGRGGRCAKPVSGGPRSGRVGESGKEWERVEQPRSARGRNRATLKASSFHTNEHICTVWTCQNIDGSID